MNVYPVSSTLTELPVTVEGTRTAASTFGLPGNGAGLKPVIAREIGIFPACVRLYYLVMSWMKYLCPRNLRGTECWRKSAESQA